MFRQDANFAGNPFVYHRLFCKLNTAQCPLVIAPYAGSTQRGKVEYGLYALWVNLLLV
jgi:hypothetical protein